MYKQILHTPEGVRDIYNGECRRKQFIQDQLHQVLLSYGYEDIQTPTFEFSPLPQLRQGDPPADHRPDHRSGAGTAGGDPDSSDGSGDPGQKGRARQGV